MPMPTIRPVRIGMVSSWVVFSMHPAYEAGLDRSGGPLGIVVIRISQTVRSLRPRMVARLGGDASSQQTG
jgi:hypothetical protein